MKTKFKELLGIDFKQGGFTIASNALSIGEKAQRIADQAKRKQKEEGEFAKFHASNIEEWMEQIAEMAQKNLDNVIESQTRK